MEHMEASNPPRKEIHAPTAKFLRVAEVARVYGLKRSFLYDLVKQERISSIVMKGRNKTRGIRLFKPEELEQIIQESTTPPKQ
jgi:predicted DNA-binding transcriptional regulator AlpA